MTWHLCHRAWLKGEFHCRLQPGKCVLRRPKREALWVKRSTSERAPAVTGVNWGRDQGGPAPLVPSLVPVGRQCLCSEEASTMGHVPAREGDGWRAQGCHGGSCASLASGIVIDQLGREEHRSGRKQTLPRVCMDPGWGALTAVHTAVRPLLPPPSRPAWMGPTPRAPSSTCHAHVPGLSSGVWVSRDASWFCLASHRGRLGNRLQRRLRNEKADGHR